MIESYTGNSGLSTNGNLRVGTYLPSDGDFKGSIDELRIWSRCLTDQEMVYAFQNNIALTNIANLVDDKLEVYYSFGESQGATTLKNSNNIAGRDLTVTGTVIMEDDFTLCKDATGQFLVGAGKYTLICILFEIQIR
jgi:hypothetical protein